MKTLYLLRHAKSSWKDEALADIDRPLKKKGRYQADLVSDHLSALLPAPQVVLCSPAVRTRETLEYFLEVWPQKKSNVLFQNELYLAERDILFSSVQALADSKDIALLVGHNPGLTDFARKLLRPESEEVDPLRPGTFLQVDFDAEHWQEVRPHTGRLKLSVHSKNLQG